MFEIYIEGNIGGLLRLAIFCDLNYIILIALSFHFLFVEVQYIEIFTHILAIGFSMAKTLERYQKCSYGALEVQQQPAVETQVFHFSCFHLNVI